VQGVLLDIKWMMARTVKHNKKDISQLARLVESIIQKTDPLAKKKDDNVERAMTM
jgi:CRISPR/Cas system CSM-associated protein Csm2 small subunit